MPLLLPLPSPPRIIIAAGQSVVEVPQPHHIVMIQDVGHAAPVAAAVAIAAALIAHIPCTSKHNQQHQS